MTLADRLLSEANWVLYHYTRMFAAYRIVQDGEFHLIYSGGTQTEKGVNGSKYDYYLSCSRVPEGGYNMNMYREADHVIFQLDGQKIAQRYAIKPVRYWPAEWGKGEPPTKRRKQDENEDRILSNRNTMPLSVCTAVHIYLPPVREEKSSPHKLAAKYGFRVDGAYDWWKKDSVEFLSKQTKVPVFFYNNMGAFRNLDTRRAIEPPEVPAEGEREEGYTPNDRDAKDIDEFSDWIEKPTDEGENRRRYYYDYIASISCLVHNAKSSHQPAVRAALLRLSRLLRRKKMTLSQAVKWAQDQGK